MKLTFKQLILRFREVNTHVPFGTGIEYHIWKEIKTLA